MGFELEGSVCHKLFGQTRYLDPASKTNQAGILRFEEKCHVIITWPHSGHRCDHGKVDNLKFARLAGEIDLTLDRHTHPIVAHPEVLPKLDNKPVTINQVGWVRTLL